MIIMGSVPIKNKRDKDKQIKKLLKEFNGKVNIEISKDEKNLIYKHYFSYKNLENQILKEADNYGNKGA